jgi:hypothetical protein
MIGRTQISRLLAFIGDWSLAYGAYNLIRGLESLAPTLGRWRVLTESLGLGHYEFALGALAAFIMLRFYSFLIFGSTPFYALLGLSCPRGFLSKRFVLPLKALLDGVCLPLFPLFCWVKWWTPPAASKRRRGLREDEESTLSEKWLGIGLIQRPEGSIQSIASFLVFPLLLLSFYAPMLGHLTWLDGVVVSQEKIELTPRGQFSRFHLLASRRFGFQWLTDFMENRFQLWPDFQFVRQGTQLRLVPKIVIYHTEREVFLTMIPGKEVPWERILRQVSRQLGPWGEKEMTEVSCQRLVKFVEESFSFGRGQLIRHTLKYGPFIRGNLTLREELLSLVDGLPETQVDVIAISENPLLRLRQRRPLPSEEGDRIVHTYIPICLRPALSFEMSYGPTPIHALAYQEFVEHILSGMVWEAPLDDRLPVREDDFHVFHFSDFLTQLQEDQLELFEAGSLRYLKNLLKVHGPADQQEFLPIIRQLMEVTELVQRRDGLKFSDEYKRTLARLAREGHREDDQ